VQCTEMTELGDILKKLSDMKFQPYQSNTATIIHSIEQYVQRVNAGE